MNATLLRDLVPCLGWTLLHFLWQGAVAAGWLAVCLRVLRKGSPNQRYLAACFAFAVMALAPVITFRHLARQESVAPAPVATSPAMSGPERLAESGGSTAPSVITVLVRVPRRVTLSQRLEDALPWLVCAWAVGVVVLSGRLLTGWFHVRRLRRQATKPLEGAWTRRLEALRERLRTSRSVRLLQSALVDVPTVIGWLRPVILLPVSSLAGLTPEQLEAILAHELAHIRRHDYLVNLCQSAVETLLFYHPAVWWVSRRIREEREHCCDDLAVRVCGDRAVYARALATLEELRPAAGPALAATGAPLLGRIRRLAGRPDKEVGRSGWLVAAVVMLTAVAAVTVALRGNRAVAESVTPSVNTETKSAGTNASGDNETAKNTDTTQLPLQVEPQDRNLFFRFQAPPPVSNQMRNPFGPTNFLYNNKSRQDIISKLESIRLDSVEYDGLPLSEVTRDLSDRARKLDPDHQGINFFISRDNPGPVSNEPRVDANGLPTAMPPSDPADVGSVIITINPPLRNVRLGDVIVAITRNAPRPIGLAVEDRAVVFFSKPNDQMPLYSQVFPIDRQTASEAIARITAGGGTSSNTDAARNYVITTNDPAGLVGTIRNYFIAAGVDFTPGNSKSIFYNDRKGTLLVHATAADLDIIAAALQALGDEPVDKAGSTNASPGSGQKQRSVRIFRIDPKTVYNALAKLPGNSEGGAASSGVFPGVPPPANDGNDLLVRLRNYLTTAGVDFTPGSGRELSIDERTGSLVVQAAPADMDKVDAALKTLDVGGASSAAPSLSASPPSTNLKPHIKIVAKIFEISQSAAGTPGFDFLLGTNLAGIETNASAAAPAPLAFHVAGTNWNTNLQSMVTNSVVNQMTGILTAEQSRAITDVLQKRSGAEVLSTPQITTWDKGRAELEIGEMIPIVTGVKLPADGKKGGTNSLQTTQMLIGTAVNVVPHVSDDGRSVELNVTASLTRFLGYDRPPKPAKKTDPPFPLPKIELRQLTAKAMVGDGQTLMLGGVGGDETVKVKDKVPLLGDIPLLGRPFRHQTTNHVRKDIIILLTPTVVTPEGTPVHGAKEGTGG